MRRLLSFIAAALLLLTMNIMVSAEENISPPISFTSLKKDTGEIEVTVNWEKQPLKTFEYAVVYDAAKVKVKSIRMKGEFLSKYSGNGKDYGGLAVANDNGGYVVMGGVFDVKEGKTAPEYDGVMATIVLVPRTSGDSSTEVPDEAESPDNTNEVAGDFDAGELKVVDSISDYANGEEIIQAADTSPMISFNVDEAVKGNNGQSVPEVPEGSSAEIQETPSMTEPSSVEELLTVSADALETSGESTEPVSSEAADNADVSPSAGTVNTAEPDHAETEGTFPVWVLIAGICLAAAAVVVVIRRKVQKQ